MAERFCHAGAGVVSAVWPGTGTVIGYNTADLAISLFFIGPLADRYISMEPPPAAMDAGALEGDPPIPGPIVLDADDQALQGTHLHICVHDGTAQSKVPAKCTSAVRCTLSNCIWTCFDSNDLNAHKQCCCVEDCNAMTVAERSTWLRTAARTCPRYQSHVTHWYSNHC